MDDRVQVLEKDLADKTAAATKARPPVRMLCWLWQVTRGALVSPVAREAAGRASRGAGGACCCGNERARSVRDAE